MSVTFHRLEIPAEFLDIKPPLHTLPVAKLEPIVEWDRFCRNCDKVVRFVADRVCVSGLIGECIGCGDERIAPFTRMNSEVV